MPAADAHSRPPLRPLDENVGGGAAALGATRPALPWLGDWSRLYPDWVATARPEGAGSAVSGLLPQSPDRIGWNGQGFCSVIPSWSTPLRPPQSSPATP